MRRAWLALVACSSEEVAPPPPSPPPPVVLVDAADRWNVTPPAIDAGPVAKHLCTELDRAAVARAIGLSGPLLDMGGYQLGGPAWGTPGMRACDWMELGTFRGFAVSLDAGARIDTRESADPNGKLNIVWRRYDGLATPAMIGHRRNVTTLQTVSHNAQVEVEVVEVGLPREKGERLVVLAMQAVLAQLPADATVWIAAPPAPPSLRNIPPIR